MANGEINFNPAALNSSTVSEGYEAAMRDAERRQEKRQKLDHSDHEVTCYWCGHQYIWAYEIWPCPQCKRRQPGIF
jgi:rubrerythrin